MRLKGYLDPDWEKYLIGEYALEGDEFILLEEQEFVFFPAHEKPRPGFDWTLSTSDTVLLWLYLRLHH